MLTVTSEKAVGSRAVVMGCACVIFSALTPEDIRRFKTLHPEALKMTDADSGTSFSIDIGEGPGRIRPEGATFSRITSSEGKATITVLMDPEMHDPISLVKSQIGSSLMSLFALEARLTELLPTLDDEEKELERQITRI